MKILSKDFSLLIAEEAKAMRSCASVSEGLSVKARSYAPFAPAALVGGGRAEHVAVVPAERVEVRLDAHSLRA